MRRPHVVVLGGGFAGLETVFYLRHKLEDKVNLTLVSDKGYFLFKPSMIYIPFGEDPEQYKLYLDPPMRKKQIDFVEQQVHEIDIARGKVMLRDFDMSYDYLVVATGASMRPAEVPGLGENAVSIWTPEDMLRLREAYHQLSEKAQERRQRLVFALPLHNAFAGPLYEMAMMTDTRLREQGVRDNVEITWATFEQAYLQAFGPRLNYLMADEFNQRGIIGMLRHDMDRVESGRAHFRNGESLEYDLLVTFPPHVPATRYSAFPCDERGFLKVEPESRRVEGLDRVFAVGDNASFPVKQAFLALLQADAAADHIAAELLKEEPQVFFEPMSLNVMEELNKAAFAQTPYSYTGDPHQPIEVNTEDYRNYKVGVSPVWRMGKKVMGRYLPWRFGHGEPFHTGLAWDAVDLSLKVASKVMAT